jgi:predicted nucleotidyltransferase
MSEGVSFDRILHALVEGGVDFVLIGGLALGSWGVVRATKDVDIVAEDDQGNQHRLAVVVSELGGHVQRPDALASTPFAIASLLAGDDRVLVETPLGQLDVVKGLPGVPAYAALAARAVPTELLGVTVNVCSLEDLRAMKRAAGRTRDLADLEDLDAMTGS